MIDGPYVIKEWPKPQALVDKYELSILIVVSERDLKSQSHNLGSGFYA